MAEFLYVFEQFLFFNRLNKSTVVYYQANKYVLFYTFSIY
jgi:hypothetical protein